MTTGRERRILLGLGRLLLVVVVVAGVAVLVRNGDDRPAGMRLSEPTGSPAPTAGLPSSLPTSLPTGLPTVYPTPDFTLPSIPPMTRPPVRGTWDFIGATANLAVRLDDAAAIADVERLAADSSVIGLNEITRERAATLRAWAAERPGWWFYSPVSARNAYQGLNAILVNTRTFRVLDQGVLFGSPASMRGYRIDSRWITWAFLEHRRSKTRVSWVQTHMDAAVEAEGRPRGGSAQRIRNNLEYMRVLRSTVEQLAKVGEVVVGGDWNVDARSDHEIGHASFPYSVLQGRGTGSLPGLRSVYSALGFKTPATRSGRWIDYLLLWQRPANERVLRFRDYRIVSPVNSDHHPVQAILRITR